MIPFDIFEVRVPQRLNFYVHCHSIPEVYYKTGYGKNGSARHPAAMGRKCTAVQQYTLCTQEYDTTLGWPVPGSRKTGRDGRRQLSSAAGRAQQVLAQQALTGALPRKK